MGTQLTIQNCKTVFIDNEYFKYSWCQDFLAVSAACSYWSNFPAVSACSFWPWFSSRNFSGMRECKKSSSWDRKTFLAWGNVKNSVGVGKMSRYQKRDCLSLVMKFPDGKLEQEGFFPGVAPIDCPKIPALHWFSEECSSL
jgi:hypothetical protein